MKWISKDNLNAKKKDLFSAIKGNTISDKMITVFAHNGRSLSKHIDDIVNDDRIINNDIIDLQKHKSIHQILPAK